MIASLPTVLKSACGPIFVRLALEKYVEFFIEHTQEEEGEEERSNVLVSWSVCLYEKQAARLMLYTPLTDPISTICPVKVNAQSMSSSQDPGHSSMNASLVEPFLLWEYRGTRLLMFTATKEGERLSHWAGSHLSRGARVHTINMLHLVR